MARQAFWFEIQSFPCVWHDAAAASPGALCINRDIHIIHILRGRGCMKVGDAEFPIVPGRAFWIPPLTRYACGKEAGEPLEMVNIHFHLELADTPVSAQVRMPPTFMMPAGVVERLREWGVQWRQGGRMAQARIVAAAHGLILDYLDRYAQPREDVRPPDPRMTALRDDLESHPQQAYDAEHFARRIHLSVSQMNRCFRETFGMSPRVFHEQRRLAHAQSLLQQDNAPMKLIAAKLGFCDAFYFSRWFTRHCGMAPTLFRRENGRL